MATSTGDDHFVHRMIDASTHLKAPVERATRLEFPLTAPDPVQVTTDIQSARSAAESAQTVAWLGVGVGILGLVLAAGMWLTRPRKA